MTDDLLYQQFLSGELSALDQLLLRYGDMLTSYLHAFLPNVSDAEDLMIEAFARIMVKKPAIREGAFKAYLYKTARNLALRFLAKQKREKAFCMEEIGEEMAGSRNSTEDRIADQERRAALHRTLLRIGDEYREALWLVYMEDLSYAQAAEVLHVSTKKIDNLLMRGKKALRGELEKEGIFNAYE